MKEFITIKIPLPKPDKDGYIWLDDTTCVKAKIYYKAIKKFIKKNEKSVVQTINYRTFCT